MIISAADKKFRVNDTIRAKEVRLIGADGEQVGVVEIRDALSRAESSGLDLVEISPQANPPVCRIMDFGKFLYQQTKKRAEARKKQKQIQIKEVKIRPVIEEGDYQVKLRKIVEFLEEGDKVKVTLAFRGREMAHHELGMQRLGRLRDDISQFASIEQEPRFEGRQVIMMLGPKKK
jgi:translation initiation factor IF-3